MTTGFEALIFLVSVGAITGERKMDRPVTIKDLAKDLNVSVTTISKALNNHPDISSKRKREIVDYAAKVNYTPNMAARNFRKQSSVLVGVIIDDNANYYNARVIKGIEICLFRGGYHPIIINHGGDAEKELTMVKELHRLNVAGVLICPAPGSERSRDYLKEAGIPYVLINRYIDRDEDSQVVVDHENAAYTGVNYLATYGLKKIFFLNYIPEISTSKDKLSGYKKALNENNIEFDPEYVIENCLTHIDGYETMNRILCGHAPPFSIFCENDYLALGALCLLQERGYLSPDTVPVLGMGDFDILSFVKPRLSTIGVPKYRLGYKASEILIELINRKLNSEATDDEPPEDIRVVMNAEMIIRETC